MVKNFDSIKRFHVEQVLLMNPDPNPNNKIRQSAIISIILPRRDASSVIRKKKNQINF